MKQVVVADANVVALDDVTTSKGYVMVGRKGRFIVGRDTDGKFIWVRLAPVKVVKTYHRFDSLKEAIEAKINLGYEVFEYTDIDELLS